MGSGLRWLKLSAGFWASMAAFSYGYGRYMEKRYPVDDYGLPIGCQCGYCRRLI